MDSIQLLPKGSIGRGFIPKEYLPDGKDEHYIRDGQSDFSKRQLRRLRPDEIIILKCGNNVCADWNEILVAEEFDPALLRGNEFFGRVRIGRVRDVVLQHHDLRMQAGIYGSRIISCDIGDDVALHQVRYLAHYIIGDRCILSNIGEMQVTDHAKFGNGILKDGEDEEVRVWIEVMNEAGGRRIMPFDGMLAADAFLWAKYRDDAPLQKRLGAMTQNRFDSRRGFYGSIGEQCVIKNCGIIKDVKIGGHCYMKGANKVKNVTINSTAEEPTQIGEGVELVNGIIGCGCHIFYGCKAVRFILADHSNLKYGARLVNSFLGDNSTISCCEVLHNLIFPAHEQHHNNSFLIASLVMGQSNLAAGATIGSNHNSRSNDNELVANRGFWPGLCVSLKHPSRFASFVMLAKADFPCELDIPLPFSLVNNNASLDRLEVIPAFWWRYNMFALERNNAKFAARDKRLHKSQHIEFEALAPDTAEELFRARDLIALWTAKAFLKSKGEEFSDKSETDLTATGRSLLENGNLSSLEITGESMERSSRPQVVLKAVEGYAAYGEMLHAYAMRALLEWFRETPSADFISLGKESSGDRERAWINCGGQLMRERDLDALRAAVGASALPDWDAVHRRYDELWRDYPREKRRHAMATLCDLLGVRALSPELWVDALNTAVRIKCFIRDQVLLSRQKDDENPFRRATFRNRAEMEAAVGTAADNAFIGQIRAETESFIALVNEVKRRG
jgi:hypothetical protein